MTQAGARSKGGFVQVIVDRDIRRPVPVLDEWRRKIEAVS
jgi:acyl-CoA thioesterase FadM